MSLAEQLRKVEIKEREFEPTVEAALDFLLDLTKKVESFEIDQVVLATNLLQEGQRGPSAKGRLIRNIPTESGYLSVSNETWKEAIERYLERLGIPIEFLFENLTEGALGDESTKTFENRPNLGLRRIREYNPESNQLTSLRLEIFHRLLSY